MFAQVRARGGSESKRQRAGRLTRLPPVGSSCSTAAPPRPAHHVLAVLVSAAQHCSHLQVVGGGSSEAEWGWGQAQRGRQAIDLGSTQRRRPAPTNPLSSPECAQSENRVKLLQLTQVGSPANNWSYSGVRSWRTMRSFITNWSISSCASSSVILPA